MEKLAVKPTKVAVCQVPDILKDVETPVEWIKKFTQEAEEKQVSLICFPECFLQGYLTGKLPDAGYATDIHAHLFNKILNQLAKYSPMIVLGLVEEDQGLLFNTAVVFKDGLLLGKYRKTHLLDGETVFTAGAEYPVFEVNNLKFGINICYDAQFPEATTMLTDQEAKLVLCVSNTMMSRKKAEKFKYLHFSMRAERAKENQIRMLSSDITGERDGRIAYGSTSAKNPAGEIVKQISFMETGMIIVEI